jgi:LuxR family maltose regulon positive regulatory protein
MHACACLHAGDLGSALKHFSVAAGQRYILHARAAVDTLAGLALTQKLMKQENAARESVGLLQEFALELGDTQYVSVAQSCRARIDLLCGDVGPALEWARCADEAVLSAGLFMFLEVPSIAMARVLIEDGTETSLEKADRLLGEVRRVSEKCCFVNQIIEAAVLQCLSLHSQGRRDEAIERLSEAVTLAETGGWVRPFVEAAASMEELLDNLPKTERDRQFVGKLLSAVAEYGKSKGTAAGAPVVSQPLIEPLTNRELDVLELLAKRMYDKEIAEALSISVGTVKTHLKHIYGKLDVPGRRHAVNRANELGLLQD